MNNQLDVQMSWWAMDNLDVFAGNAPSDEEKIALIASSGYDGINGFLPSPEQADYWKHLLDKYHLSFSVNAYPKSVEDLANFLERARAFGGIGFINAQVMQPFMTGESAIQLLKGIQQLSKDAGIPVFVETHRGTITQDLIRTVEYVRELKSLPLTIDFSHYIVAGEMHTVSQEADELLLALLSNTSSIHTRISNGEQIQIDPGEEQNHPMFSHFKKWWQLGMTNWQLQANTNDVFPVVIELGPPPYAITTNEASGRNKEISDRWQQSLYLQRVVRELWSTITP
ncbi:sugar phosphate isomerase/epimerase family protein [Paenibacillus alginolyticus]|uniref:Sugar phosphate isomerase/epimerase n=1 Tax=Paenibacillus alginolyticus TaxID=59839 RepID=A0ABT4GID9_9BACL|nr:sugar phosphate isomerase/epimerase [Paenibacillus alginolyticus]MCY9695886.1 sugar phosphate isomerase/epimerase [Paenibacillus alginolyticus]MEC0141761.1 sugar phosphate isomerase/epimerase [Paenibacillus alginolyticus]